ncbi:MULTISPECIES: sulfoacetaldehyde acetyltransferase [unclassified Vibrio]|uniref:sulfoacetaldehyde acetyltransferase n=1 Tax=unclassified Vibrio TaxID=2614977 RepID=UPI0035508B89
MSKQEKRTVVSGTVTMTPSEAFVETMVANDVTDMFGIMGSAFMDAMDIFAPAGIRLVPVVHEQGAAHMADGYSRVSGRHGVVIGQNGPGISNCVTAIAAAFWAHSPVVIVTPETGTKTMGLGGFQECNQLPMFQEFTKYQGHVTHPDRMAEYTGRCFDRAMSEMGPTQLNIPRDYFYGETQTEIPKPARLDRGPGGEKSLNEAADLIAEAKFPVIISGGGVVMADAVQECAALAERLGAPVVNSYLHNDSFPASHPLWCGPLGYQGSKAAAVALSERLEGRALLCDDNKGARQDTVATEKALWEKELDEWTHERDSFSLDMIEENSHETPFSGGEYLHPRQVLRELEKAMPEDVMVSTDIGNINSVANSYLRFEKPRSFFAAMSFGNCGYAFPTIIGAKAAAPHRPAISYAGDGAWGMSLMETMTCVRHNIPVTAVVFHNRQWGAEKKNQVDFYNRRFVAGELDNQSFAEIARAMGAEGITVDKLEDVGPTLQKAIDMQMNEGKTTIIEIMCTQELGDPFRRDALSTPVRFLDKYKDYV